VTSELYHHRSRWTHVGLQAAEITRAVQNSATGFVDDFPVEMAFDVR
jgi:hypothetical protein